MNIYVMPCQLDCCGAGEYFNHFHDARILGVSLKSQYGVALDGCVSYQPGFIVSMEFIHLNYGNGSSGNGRLQVDLVGCQNFQLHVGGIHSFEFVVDRIWFHQCGEKKYEFNLKTVDMPEKEGKKVLEFEVAIFTEDAK